MYHNYNKNNQLGFSLIEILIAIFILAIGTFGVMALFPVGIHQTDKIFKTTLGAISSETPVAYALYKYPAESTGSTDHNILGIINLISGTTTPTTYSYPATGTITISGNPSYGWTTSIVPIDLDGNGTATSISETYLFRQQIAIYKSYTANNGTASFSYNSKTISNVSNVSKISVNDFICNAQNSIWYRVTGVNKSANSVTIQQNYEYGTATAAPYISTNTIAGIFNTTHSQH
jgi:prepilin-type N-terminal cleavage/methylation domain-containing protein